jgi:thiamine-phosphate pyrophosphorylase
MSWRIPLVYPILDASFLPAEGRVGYLERLGHSLADAGVGLLEYRNKTGTDAEVLGDALVLREAMQVGQVRLVLDDRVDVALAAGFDGVHVDAGDLPPAVARSLMGGQRLVGTSAGNEEQLMGALGSPVDYIAFGPVFPTTTKQTSATPIGIDGVRSFRAMTGAQATLVAAAGITLETAPLILAAGADAVAVAAALFRSGNPAEEFGKWMGRLT